MGETGSTGDNARTRLTFADGTRFTISKNTTFRIDEYVCNPSSRRNAMYWFIGEERIESVAKT